MATRSMISIHQNDGKIRSVYCHWDGYFEHNGVILYNFYNTPEKVKELISYGDISSLGTEIGKKHDFGKLYYGCTFYHRDRGEDLDIREMDITSNINPYVQLDEEEYNYIFVEKTGKWIAKKENELQYHQLESIFKKITLDEWMIDVSNQTQYEKIVDFYNKFGQSYLKMPKFDEVKYEI